MIATFLKWTGAFVATFGGLYVANRLSTPIGLRVQSGDSVKVLSSKVNPIVTQQVGTGNPANDANVALAAFRAFIAQNPTGIVEVTSIIVPKPGSAFDTMTARGIISPGFPVEFNLANVISATRNGRRVIF